MVRSSDCFTRLRVIATRPKSLNCRTFDGARSCLSASSRACITFCRLRRSSISMEAIGEPQNALVLLLVIHPDGGEIRGHLVPQHALHYVQVVIDQRRGLAVFRAALDFTPEVLKEADVGAQLFFGGALRRSAHDET